MADVVNLNRAKKLRQRLRKRAEADENAVKFGRTGAQKAVERKDAQRARATLDAHRREGDTDP